MIENWRFEIGGDVVVGHGWTWSKGTKRQRLRSILCDAGNFSCGAPYVVANGMLRGPASTMVKHSASCLALQCSKLSTLVLNLFSHYLLFDRKNEVYDVHDSGALSRTVRG
jgi:hypothetical protein